MELGTDNQPSINVQPHYSSQPEMAPVISIKEWLLTMLLLAIPFVNLIMLLVWGFGGGANKSKANYSKAVIIWFVGVAIMYFLLAALIVGVISSLV